MLNFHQHMINTAKCPGERQKIQQYQMVCHFNDIFIHQITSNDPGVILEGYRLHIYKYMSQKYD